MSNRLRLSCKICRASMELDRPSVGLTRADFQHEITCRFLFAQDSRGAWEWIQEHGYPLTVQEVKQ